MGMRMGMGMGMTIRIRIRTDKNEDEDEDEDENNNSIHGSISTQLHSSTQSTGIRVMSVFDIGQTDSPTLFEKCSGFFKVPCIRLVEIRTLDQQLNVPTNAGRVA